MEDNMTNLSTLKLELRQFTGTDQWYVNPLFRQFLYTDGIKYLAEQAGAYWLIDYIFSQQRIEVLRNEPFQVWKIEVKDSQAILRVEDGNTQLLKHFELEFTDFPLEEMTLWFTDRVLMLPSEY